MTIGPGTHRRHENVRIHNIRIGVGIRPEGDTHWQSAFWRRELREVTMRILIDIDAVLANLAQEVSKHVEMMYGVQLEPALIDCWDYKVDGISLNQEIRRLQKVPGFLLSLSPTPGAVHGLRELVKNHRVSLATGRPKFTSHETAQWVHETFGLCLPISFGRASKGCDADVLIDDNPDYIREFLMCNPKGRGILFNMTWNQLGHCGGKIIRGMNWNHVLNIVKSLDNGMIVITLTQGRSTTIDDTDKDLSDMKWCSEKAYNTCYATRRVNTEKVRMHRIIMSRILNRELLPGEQVDHIDGNGLNNRRYNLRLASNAQNQFNASARRNGSSRYKGVYYDKHAKKWVAHICIRYANIWIGLFDSENDAARAYNGDAIKFFGEFARLNNIGPKSI